MLSQFAIDLSNNDPIFDPVLYRQAGHVLVGLKITEGTGFVDKNHAELAHKAGSEHIAVCHYHFARPDAGNSPQAECDHFLHELHRGDLIGPRDFVVLDLERATPQGWAHDPAWSKRFDQHLRANTDRFQGILLYSFASAFSNGAAADWFAGPPFRVWDANFSTHPDSGPRGSTVVMRQFTDGVFGPLPHGLPGGPRTSDVNAMRGAFRQQVFAHAA